MPFSSTPVAAFLQDSSGYQGTADRVVVPGTTEDVREIVRACSAQKIPLTIAGAGTGLTGARVPHGGWVLSLERFRTLEIVKGRARCGANVTLADLSAEASKSNQFFGPNPTETSASIGGVIATNAGGARSFHYGSVRRDVLALEVTFMDGRTIEYKRGDKVDFAVGPVPMPKTTKNAAGYYVEPPLDWVDLLSGSEGTLGIVTEAEVNLFPEPHSILSGVVFFPSDEHALDAVDVWRPIPDLRLLEYMDAAALKLLKPFYPEIPTEAAAALLVEQNVDVEEDEVDLWAQRLEQSGAFEEQSWFGFAAADRERFRQFRHTLPTMVVDRTRRNGFPKFGTDFAVPIERHRELHSHYRRRCEELFPGQYTIFGHVGDANNHVNLLPDNPRQAEQAEQLIHEFARHAVSLGGTVAAEHGIGKTKTDLLALMYSADELQAMREVKQRLDPQGLLGQGTIFPA